jgi:hypothetical protein
LSAVVSRINAQRSVEIRLCGKDGWHPQATSPSRPSTASRHRCVIEVRYLYALDAAFCINRRISASVPT